MKLFSILLVTCIALSQSTYNQSAFKQIDELLPSPNRYRDASGAPGPDYWQQKVDYKMNVVLDEEKRTISGKETVTYHNNSPISLRYLWFQLDQNIRKRNSDANQIKQAGEFPADDSFNFDSFKKATHHFDGGYQIKSVKDENSRRLNYSIHGTNMRVDLTSALKTGRETDIKIEWSYPINDLAIEGRSGYEFFESDSNYVFTIAQFFPRAATFTNSHGWQVNQFLGKGEFALEFGNYDVKITVPADHILGATGVLQNESSVLTSLQRKRLKKQRSSNKVRFIVRPDEAKEAVKKRSKQKKTWHFKAKQVRDFAFASSRRFIWDASSVKSGKKRVLTMSFYPKEGMPLWDKYSTHLVRHTIQNYNKYTFDYPYPTAISVHANDQVGGMEYPMICFNGGRPNADGTFTKSTRDFLILVIIHEVGHNYFPMIVSSDERQWTWMDEGLNSFLQFLAEREWDPNYDSQAGPADLIVDYMKSTNLVPIMSNSEALLQFGNNAYNKPTTAFNILRESVLGRERFDFAFKQYSKLWKFKHPEPADFFRTMENASGQDLDWFWRAWFYTTKYVNQSIDKVELFRQESEDPRDLLKSESKSEKHITDLRNNLKDGGYVGRHDLSDIYSSKSGNLFQTVLEDTAFFDAYYKKLSPKEKAILNDSSYFYRITFKNPDKRSMVMPLILEMQKASGKKEILRIPVEAWIKDEKSVTKLIVSNEKILRFELDPLHEFPDIDRSDNVFPRETKESEFFLFKQQQQFLEPLEDLKLDSTKTVNE